MKSASEWSTYENRTGRIDLTFEFATDRRWAMVFRLLNVDQRFACRTSERERGTFPSSNSDQAYLWCKWWNHCEWVRTRRFLLDRSRSLAARTWWFSPGWTMVRRLAFVRIETRKCASEETNRRHNERWSDSLTYDYRNRVRRISVDEQ